MNKMVDTKPIRILHVLTAMNMAGAETLLMNIYRNIDRTKIQFDFAVSATQESAYDVEIKKLGGKLIHYPRYTGKNHFQYVKWWDVFLDSHPEYHIVHGHIGSTAAIYLMIAKNKGRFTIAHSHSTNSTLSLHAVLYKLFSYPTRYIAEQFFGCSKQALIDRYGKLVANSAKARVINNAIDAKKYVPNLNTREQVRKQYEISNGTIVIGTVGRLTRQKNPFEIIRICRELKDRGVSFVFLWFGTGELEKQIYEQIKINECCDVIRLCGTRMDIYNVLQAIDIFLFPSIWEGLGIACVEAQAAGIPTFCSDTIPNEAQVTPLMKKLTLNDTKSWCDEVEGAIYDISKEGYQKADTYTDIIKAGYDINNVARWLQTFYLKKEMGDYLQ